MIKYPPSQSRSRTFPPLPPTPIENFPILLYSQPFPASLAPATLDLLPVTIVLTFLEFYMLLISRFSCVQLFASPWTVARQAPLSMGFSRQEHWNGLPCPPPGDPPDPGMELASLTSPALAGEFFTASDTLEAHHIILGLFFFFFFWVCVWFLSFGIILFRCMHFVACIISSFLSLTG